MKRLFAIFVALCAAFVAVAQSENSIIIDQNSFRPLQSDALTGVNIDPIGVDSSRRPCARIKVKINRMSREDINKLEVKIHSNNQLTKCKTADYENGLILEMTAKPATRFYFHHPEFGYSNEVNINLEPNKEYYLEASLNQTYSIVVNSDLTDAEIYIDDEYKGRIDSSNSLTIKGVLVGEHALKLICGTIVHEQKINVNSGEISFTPRINTAVFESQFVVFTVEPQNAVVLIDDKHYGLTDGAMREVLDSGTHNYTVSAAGYHSESGTFTVAGEKVTKNITLTADSATVTLTVADNAEIWVNGVKKGTSNWSGTLNSGAYIFEAKKAGHKTTTTSKHITSDNPRQSYVLPTPVPIYGSMMVDGSPINAYVILDDKGVGQIPLKLNNVLIGNHTLKISKAGYKDYTQTITISEGKTTTVNATLEKYITTVPQTTTNVPSGESLAIVVNTNVAGAEVYIDEQYKGRTDGSYNLTIMDIPIGEHKLKVVYNGVANEQKIKVNRENIFFSKYVDTAVSTPQYVLFGVEPGNAVVTIDNQLYVPKDGVVQIVLSKGTYNYTVTAAGYFPQSGKFIVGGSKIEKHIALQPKTTDVVPTPSYGGRYKVGDYYNENGKKGVVFYVDYTGEHGKIVSLDDLGGSYCFYNNLCPEAKNTFYGIDNREDGRVNLNNIMKLLEWRNRFPIINDIQQRLGQSWYLPAIEELEMLMLVRSEVNVTLKRYGKEIGKRGDHLYWSSTEYNAKNKNGYYCVLGVDLEDGKTYRVPKSSYGLARAITTF